MASSRWQHRCPVCGKIVRWRKVFCRACIAAYPSRGHIQLGVFQTDVAGKKLTGFPKRKAKIIVRIGNINSCLCCGRKSEKRSKHRCYFRMVRSHDWFRCFGCKSVRSVGQFPVVFITEKIKVRSVLCAECLAGKEVVLC